MTQDQKEEMYLRGASPKNKSTRYVINKGEPQHLKLEPKPIEPKGKKHTMDKVMAEYGKQTLASSVKTRAIVKNNFGMPRINNKFFKPVNRAEAKDTIFRQTTHDYELDETQFNQPT